MILKIAPFFLLVALLKANPISVVNVFADEEDLYRLQETVVPSNYKLDLTLGDKFAETAVYTGSVVITFKVEEEIDSFRIHMDQSIYDSSKDNYKLLELGVEGAETVITTTASYDPKYETTQFKINDDIKLKKDTSYTLTIDYTGKLYNDMYGFYLSSYKDDDKYHFVATTQFQATYARRAFPCFDEPKFKATFDITINHPETYTALANTKAKTTRAKTTTFETTPKMSTYLVAFVVSDFAKLESDDKKFNIWVRENALDTAKYSLEVTPGILSELESFTNIPYWQNNAQLDQVAISDFGAGAMENWGLVTYRETALLWDPAESTMRSKQRIATVIAHEFAHMWFGNLVTLDWWSVTWLNEGFARYFEYHATMAVEKTWELEKQFAIEQQQVIMVTDGVSTALPLTSAVSTPSEVSNKFASLTYNKGASVIRMMEHFMKHEQFKAGLQTYLKDHQLSNTLPSHLFTALGSQFTSEDVPLAFDVIMKEWTENSGYPTVTAALKENKVILTQERFLYDDAKDTTKWNIPISYTTTKEHAFDDTAPKLWLLSTDENKEFELTEEQWVILNMQETAYYRVNYDAVLWQRIKDGLLKDKFDNIHVLNRAQIVDDSLNLARAGKLAYSEALDITKYLANEVEYYPWYSAFNAFSYLRRRTEGDLKNNIDAHITKLMGKLYEHVDFEITEEEDQIAVFKNTLALQWACELNHDDCFKTSLEMFKSYKDDKKTIDPNLRSVVYCAAMRHAEDNTNWEFLRDKLETSNLASEQATITTALGCTKDVVLLEKYLLESITTESSGIRKQDAYSVFTAVVTGNPEGVKVAFEFLKANHGKISESYASMNALSSVINTIADRFTTADEIADFEKFVVEAGDELKDAQVIAKTAIISAKANIAWVQNNKETLTIWLENEYQTTTDKPTSTDSTTDQTTTDKPTSTDSTTDKTTTAGGVNLSSNHITLTVTLFTFFSYLLIN